MLIGGNRERIEATDAGVAGGGKVHHAIHQQGVLIVENGLELEQIGDAPDTIFVGTVGQFPDDVAVDLAFMGDQKPYPAADQRSGEGRARRPVIEPDSLYSLQRRNKIRGRSVKSVAAIGGLKRRETRRALAE